MIYFPGVRLSFAKNMIDVNNKNLNKNLCEVNVNPVSANPTKCSNTQTLVGCCRRIV